MTVMVYLGYYVYTKTDTFVITEVNIIAQNRVEDEEVLKLLGDRPYYFNFSDEELTEIVEKHPVIKTCKVTKVFPNQIDIVLAERQGVIALSYSDQYLLIDEDLVVVEAATSPKTYYEVSGYSFDSFQVGREIIGPDLYILDNVVDLVYFLYSYDLLETTEILIDNKEIFLKFNADLIANLGTGENMHYRIHQVVELYRTIKADGNAMGTIIMNHDGLPSLLPFNE